MFDTRTEGATRPSPDSIPRPEIFIRGKAKRKRSASPPSRRGSPNPGEDLYRPTRRRSQSREAPGHRRPRTSLSPARRGRVDSRSPPRPRHRSRRYDRSESRGHYRPGRRDRFSRSPSPLPRRRFASASARISAWFSREVSKTISNST